MILKKKNAGRCTCVCARMKEAEKKYIVGNRQTTK